MRGQAYQLQQASKMGAGYLLRWIEEFSEKREPCSDEWMSRVV